MLWCGSMRRLVIRAHTRRFWLGYLGTSQRAGSAIAAAIKLRTPGQRTANSTNSDGCPTASLSEVTDVVMPAMDGWELGRRLAVDMPVVPVLYISAYPARTSFIAASRAHPFRSLRSHFRPSSFSRPTGRRRWRVGGHATELVGQLAHQVIVELPHKWTARCIANRKKGAVPGTSIPQSPTDDRVARGCWASRPRRA
jgi:CheY-like chemotaxis protein